MGAKADGNALKAAAEGIPIGLGAHHDQLVNCLEALV
eukprot:CAMPEP_0204527704 /NCGR_PEP_ID=MMETSP0661-20131031/9104_1 /ASSEMBLY_ACC=CAM_ASM_000606 /TAXON_ID=109239 /ORGANISM="Alexandrium margalefi, Strain AMGDE01CS-322" /LENGTH=36 /DNA_ID= /DNA_START= /DNA_END= /DNA_ORIENTATION=